MSYLEIKGHNTQPYPCINDHVDDNMLLYPLNTKEVMDQFNECAQLCILEDSAQIVRLPALSELICANIVIRCIVPNSVNYEHTIKY